MEEVIKVEDCGENIGDYDIPIHNAIIIPRDATNRDVLIRLYPNLKYTIQNGRVVTTIGVAASFDFDWWKAPYKGTEG